VRPCVPESKGKKEITEIGMLPKVDNEILWAFEVLERIGPIAYMLSFSASMRVQNVFNVSLLKKCVLHPNHVIDWTAIHVEHTWDFWVELVIPQFVVWKVDG
jgi:hypothetical protein